MKKTMKRMTALLLAVLMLIGMTACSGGKDKTESETEKKVEETTQTEEAVKLVSHGRVSAINAPEGWELGETSSDAQLAYECKYEEFADSSIPVRLWIDIDTVDTAEAMAARAKEINTNEEAGFECQEEKKTIGGVEYIYIIPSFGYRTLYGTINGVTVCVSHDTEVSLDDEAVQAIIESIQIQPE